MAAPKFRIGDVVGEYKELPQSVMSLDSSGDLILLASKHSLNLLNLSNPNVVYKHVRKNVKWEVNAAQWNPHKSDRGVFVVTRNQMAEIYVHINGKIDLKSTLQSHTRSIADLDWSPFDSNLILTCSADGSAFLWDCRKCSSPAQIYETLQSCSASQVKWNKIEEHIFATSHDRDIRVWDTRKTDRPIYISGHLKKIHGLDWSPHNSKQLASASEDETVKFWDYSSRASQHHNNYNIGELKSSTNSPIWKARYAPFENSLLTIDVSQLRIKGDNSLMLWSIEDLTSPEHKFTFVGHSDVVTEFQWRKPRQDNQYQLVTWSRDSTLRISNYETASSPQVIGMMDGRRSGCSTEAKNQRNNRMSGEQKKVEPPPKVVEEDDLDDESSPDELIPNKSPARTGAKKETVPTSPNVSGNTLQNEFRFLSTITDVDVQTSSMHRKCVVSVINKGKHRIRLLMSFPENYPEGDPPTFRFDEDTTLDKTLQGKLVTELDEAASPLIANHKACVEKCIYQLKKSIDELESKNALDLDARFQSIYNAYALSASYNKNIPYPRTCGATFCNDRLITFQRIVHPAAQVTPRSLSDGQTSLTPHSARNRSGFFPSQLSRSPKDNIVPAYLKRSNRNKPLFKKEKSGPIFIYDMAALLPVNKSLALDYKLEGTAQTCRHNAEVAAKHGRRDLHQLWRLLEEFMDSRLISVPASSAKPGSVVPWATLPFGRSMIESIMSHYATIGDFQTLAMVVCMFPFSCDIPPRLSDKPSTYSLQRSSSNMKMSLLSSSPAAASMMGRSPPDKSFLSIELDSLSNGWTNASIASRRRADSHNGSLQDMKNSYSNDSETDQQKLSASAQMLDPKQCYLYEFYKRTYAEQLYRWCLLDERSLLLNTVNLEGEVESSHIALTCGTCYSKYNKSWCVQCSKSLPRVLQCAMCRSGVRGPASLCLQCGHGGHVQHLRLWFESEEECPTGCGCHCLAFNGIEH